jgi:hypothetical protein
MKTGELCIYTDDWGREWICVFMGSAFDHKLRPTLCQSYVWSILAKDEWVVYTDCLEVLSEAVKKCP